MPARPLDTAPVKLPGSFCNWVTAALAPLGHSPAVHAARTALIDAPRTARRKGYYLTLTAPAPVLELLAALAADCMAEHRGDAKSATCQAARTAHGRLCYALTTVQEQPE